MEQLTQQLERLPPEKVKISQRVRSGLYMIGTVVVFPPFSIPAGSGKLYLNSRGNAGKMRENFVP